MSILLEPRLSNPVRQPMTPSPVPEASGARGSTDLRRYPSCACKALFHTPRCVKTHPCAGAMLIFSASFQSSRMIPEGNPT